MKKTEFHKYIVAKVTKEFPEVTKHLGIMTVSSDLSRSLGISPIMKPEQDLKVSKSLINHFDKLVDHLKKTSNKKMYTPCLLCGSEYLKPIDQKLEVYKAINEFLKIAAGREKHGIRNAYISFTRPRKQKIVKSEGNPEGARKGRPNLYSSEEFRYVVNRAAKIQKTKSKKSRVKPS